MTDQTEILTRTERPPGFRGWADDKAKRAAIRAALGWAWARNARIPATLPGVGTLVLIPAGLAMRFGIWAGLVSAGVLLWRVDSRL